MENMISASTESIADLFIEEITKKEKEMEEMVKANEVLQNLLKDALANNVRNDLVARELKVGKSKVVLRTKELS